LNRSLKVSSGGLEGPGLVLDAREADLVRRGIPEIEMELIPAARALAPGTPVALIAGRGRVVGAGITDPDRKVVRVWSRSLIRALDEEFFRAKVDAALALRAPLVRAGETEAWRLLHGDGDGLSGISVDVWGNFLVILSAGRGPSRWAEPLAGVLLDRLKPRGILEKMVFTEGGAAPERGKAEERVLAGEAPPGELVVKERGVPFLVRLRGTRHEGLFTDMREERKRLADAVAAAAKKPAKVLNTFAFTGSFSVIAARAGAEVTTVDIVAKPLEWAKENFRLSGLDPAKHHFARMDAGEFLALARKRGWSYDFIVLDPPTFATARGVRWSLRRDYPALIAKALHVLSPGGRLWVAANASGVEEREVDRWIAAGASAAGRKLRTIARAGQPIDYPAPEGFPRYRHLKVRVLEAI
jgi:23S rRNA (cytosine1962-C5)-methyltransferase